MITITFTADEERALADLIAFACAGMDDEQEYMARFPKEYAQADVDALAARVAAVDALIIRLERC